MCTMAGPHRVIVGPHELLHVTCSACPPQGPHVVAVIDSYRGGTSVLIFHLEFFTFAIPIAKVPLIEYMKNILELIIFSI